MAGKKGTASVGPVILHGISMAKIVQYINAEKQKAAIESFRGHTLKSIEHEGKASVWLEIARLADIRLLKKREFTRTFEGVFLVDRYEWER